MRADMAWGHGLGATLGDAARAWDIGQGTDVVAAPDGACGLVGHQVSMEAAICPGPRSVVSRHAKRPGT